MKESADAMDEMQSDTFETQAQDNEQRTSPFSRRINTSSLLEAHRLLLDAEVIEQSSQPEAFALVRMHYPRLQQWHRQHTGWYIQKSASLVRLERHVHTALPITISSYLKKPRDIACVVWILWFAERRFLGRAGNQQPFVLADLLEALRTHFAVNDSVTQPLDFLNRDHRFSMMRALEYLHEIGGLRASSEKTEQFVKAWVQGERDTASAVRYIFTPTVSALLEALSPEQVATTVAYLTTTSTSSSSSILLPHAQQLPAMIRAWRTLLLGPVLLRGDDPDAFDTLVKHVHVVSHELATSFGWWLELNRYYACIVRDEGRTQRADVSFTAAQDQMLLLLCTEIRHRVEEKLWQPDRYGCLHITVWDVDNIFSELYQRYKAYWGTVAQRKHTALLSDLYVLMQQRGLLRGPNEIGELLILPTAARYAVTYAEEALLQDESDNGASSSAQQQRRQAHEQKTEQSLWEI
jgi:uncharacterized protein (TIGR02678 family)